MFAVFWQAEEVLTRILFAPDSGSWRSISDIRSQEHGEQFDQKPAYLYLIAHAP